MLPPKKVSESRVEIAELMLPEHANPARIVHGGTIMKMIDNAAAIVASRHSQHTVVTASVDRINFLEPAYVGNVVFAKASLNNVFNTSMEVGVRVEAERLGFGEKFHAASAYLTLVALDRRRKPTEVPGLIGETPEDKRRFEEARKRRESRINEGLLKKGIN